MNRILRVTLLLVLVIALAVLEAWAGSNKADLSRTVFLGDSLTAGFQNSSLLDSQVIHGYAAVLSNQARVDLTLRLVSYPGIPPVLTLVDPGPPPVIERVSGGPTPVPENPLVQVTDLAVPGATVTDALATRPDCDFADPTLVELMTDVVLGLPGCLASPAITMSQVEWAEALTPTTIVLWLGNMDALQAVIFGADPSLVTPVEDFKNAYEQVMDRLAATGATLVVANVPDVTVIPFLTSAENVAVIVGMPLGFVGPILGIGPGDFVTPDAFPLIQRILTGAMSGPLPGDVVLDGGEVAQIRSAIAEYNAFIAAQAEARGAAFVDTHALFDSIRAKGLVSGGQRLTTGFLGGLFSLDGVHPTNTGYAVVANEFIEALNTHFAAGIPPAAVSQIRKTDPLVFPGVGHPASALGHVSPEAAASLRSALRH